MTVALSSPVTGGAQTGLTSPTYTLTADTPPDVNAKQYAITALGGTQTGVTSHTAAAPFTVTFFRPKVLRSYSIPNVSTGVIKDVPNNMYTMLVRKGVVPLANQAYRVAWIKVDHAIPAGSDTADAANIRAMASLAYGALAQVSAGFGDTLINGVL